MQFLILLLVAMVISSIGFKKFVWFISLGYGFSIAGLGVVMLLMFRNSQTPVTILLSVMCVIYGCRLGGYLIIRERKSVSYQKTMKNEIKDGADTKLFAQAMVWISCAFLYVLEVSPIFFRLQHKADTDTVAVIGTVIMAAGIILESASDFTKNRFKRLHPDRFCDVGVFKLVRCPNYLGEVLIWTGVFISGVTALLGIVEWCAALAGWICIVYIMFGGARRLEIRQNKNYGEDPEYQRYVKKTPILIPFIPLYSVEKYKWLVG